MLLKDYLITETWMKTLDGDLYLPDVIAVKHKRISNSLYIVVAYTDNEQYGLVLTKTEKKACNFCSAASSYITGLKHWLIKIRG